MVDGRRYIEVMTCQFGKMVDFQISFATFSRLVHAYAVFQYVILILLLNMDIKRDINGISISE